jgi:MYND finger
MAYFILTDSSISLSSSSFGSNLFSWLQHSLIDHRLGVVKCYCYQDLKNGIRMLKMAASHGYDRSSYTLGIILRDSLPDDAAQYMHQAASAGYLPALQEILPAREMKERFGEPNADELRRNLDPIGLNRLLLRDYVNSSELRGMNTSHCWNPLCGKWAYKASSTNTFLRMRRSAGTSAPMYDVDEHMEPPSYDDQGHSSSPNVVAGNRPVVGMVNNNNITENVRQPVGVLQRLHERLHHSKSKSSASKTTIQAMAWKAGDVEVDRVSRMKMCSRCCRAKYCSKLCQVYDWRSSQHKMECQFL